MFLNALNNLDAPVGVTDDVTDRVLMSSVSCLEEEDQLW